MQTLRLRDFDLEIGPGDGQTYPVAVLNSPSGQARATMAFPFPTAEALKTELAAVEDAVLGTGGAAANQRVQNFGARLFHALFSDEVRTVYDRSQQATSAAGEGLRIKLPRQRARPGYGAVGVPLRPAAGRVRRPLATPPSFATWNCRWASRIWRSSRRSASSASWPTRPASPR